MRRVLILLFSFCRISSGRAKLLRYGTASTSSRGNTPYEDGTGERQTLAKQSCHLASKTVPRSSFPTPKSRIQTWPERTRLLSNSRSLLILPSMARMANLKGVRKIEVERLPLAEMNSLRCDSTSPVLLSRRRKEKEKEKKKPRTKRRPRMEKGQRNRTQQTYSTKPSWIRQKLERSQVILLPRSSTCCILRQGQDSQTEILHSEY